MKTRRAVGGLISLIGLIVVFGITSVAYLELSSSQSELINTSIITNEKISDQNNERLNFTSISPGSTEYTIFIENIGSETTKIHSYIAKNNNQVIGKGELDEKIFAGKESSVQADIEQSVDPSNDVIVFVTSLGKKCVIPADVSFRIC